MIFSVQGNNNRIYSLLLHDKQLSAKALSSSVLSSSFGLVQRIVINGRIDHMAIDIRGQKLFVAEFGNNSLDIIDMKTAKRIHSIKGNNGLLNQPQSVVFVSELNSISY
jgi:DNA-binding beta-propeller fold protein YncE